MFSKLLCFIRASKIRHNFMYIFIVLHFNWIGVCVKASSSNLKCNRQGCVTATAPQSALRNLCKVEE